MPGIPKDLAGQQSVCIFDTVFDARHTNLEGQHANAKAQGVVDHSQDLCQAERRFDSQPHP